MFQIKTLAQLVKETQNFNMVMKLERKLHQAALSSSSQSQFDNPHRQAY